MALLTTELMIDDWVSQSNGNAVKIDCIKTGECGYCDKYGKMEIARTPLLEPIPLTPEILEKNGFVYESDGLTWYDGIHNKEQVYVYCPIRKNGNVRKIEIFVNKYHFFTELNTEYYVHELQHALRLCGLSELADNFKI